MKDRTPKNLAVQILDPSRHFDSPMDVVKASNLSRDAKVELLRAMETDARQKQAESHDAVAGGDADALRQVMLAIEKLDLEVKHKNEPPPEPRE